MNLPEKSFGRQIRTSPGHHFGTSDRDVFGRQIGSLGEALGMLEWDVLGTSWGPIFAGWVIVKVKDFGHIYS